MSLLEGCDLSFQKGEDNVSSQVERSQKNGAGLTVSCILWSTPETALPDS